MRAVLWRRLARHAAMLVAGALLVAPAEAQAPPKGTFFASKSCPALQSIAKGTNPGHIRVEPDQSYQVVTGNKAEPTHYLLLMPGASPERRWVAIDCGTYVAANGVTIPPHTRPVPTGDRAAPHFKTDYLLAFSWEPAFCETHGRKAECRHGLEGAAARQFSLHGLWPEPRDYCGVAPAQVAADKAGHWSALPAVRLAPAARGALQVAMPGTRSLLDRHEWIKHGTCAGLAMPRYFDAALRLLADVNISTMPALFRDNVGRLLTLQQVRAAADAAFGPGSGARLAMSCVTADGRPLIDELTIGLNGPIGRDAHLADLVLQAAPAKADCDSGYVDAPGRD